MADEVAPPPAAPPLVTNAARAPADVVSPELLAFARDGIRDGWRQVREDPVPDDVLATAVEQFDAGVRQLPVMLGRQAAEARTVAETKAAAFKTPDAVALLAAIDGDEPEAAAFVQSEGFAALFARRGGGSPVDGSARKSGDKLPEGAVVTFPAGVFAMDNLARGNDPFPADVTVRGAGMDATLLVMDTIGVVTAVRRFAIEDCTIYVDGGIFDLRVEPGMLALSRVRVVGFDCGAGGSYALDTRSVAIFASDCRFESGYGRSPGGYANLLRANGARLARFERCVFERVDLDTANARTVSFVDCSLTDMLCEQPAEPTFRGCRWTTIPRDKMWDAEYRQRDLNTLFPQWQERQQRR